MQYGYGNRKPGKYSMGGGIVLIVGNTGKSSWYGRVVVDGKETTKKLAVANQQCNLDRAKGLLLDMREQARNGVLTRRTQPNALRIANSLGSQFERWARFQNWSERHHTKTIQRAQNTLGPLWVKPVQELRRREIIEQLEKAASVDTAGRVFSWCADMFEELINEGFLNDSPLGKKPKSLVPPKSKNHPSYGTNYKAVARLYSDIKHSNRSASVRLASLTLLLTGLRNAEGRLLAVPMVNLNKKVITVPRSLMKVTDPERGDFEIPMSDELLDVMKLAVQRAESNDTLLLFPAERDSSKAVTNEAIEKAFREHSDRQHSPHGTRKSLKSFALEELEQPEHISRTLLDHKPFDDVSAHYNAATFLKQRRAILTEWAKSIAGSANGRA